MTTSSIHVSEKSITITTQTHSGTDFGTYDPVYATLIGFNGQECNAYMFQSETTILQSGQ